MTTKESVLRELSALAAGKFLSGEELALRCGISRQAVWKAVNALRSDGVRVDAVTNRGYRLEMAPEQLSAAAVNALIPEQLGAHAFVYESIDSTNSEAKRRCAAASDCHSLNRTVIVAGAQTAGRGRQGRVFFSPAGTGVYLSIIYAPEAGISSPAVLTSSAAVGVCRALQSVYGVDAQIKWVNDVFLRGKKVCGILTEGVTDFETGRIDYAVVGIGVNILPGSFPPELSAVASSVRETADEPAKINELAAAVIREVIGIYTAGQTGIAAAMKEYRSRSLLTGMTVTVCPVINKDEQNYQATVVDVTDDAKLIVRTKTGDTRMLDSGEISLHSGAVAARSEVSGVKKD